MQTRLVHASIVVLLGLAFCFVMYWWQLRYPYAAHGFGLAFFAAIPFVGLALLVVGGLGRAATSLGWLVLAGLTALAFIAAATSSSSTAVLIWIAPFAYGAVALVIISLGDGLVRVWKLVLRTRRDWRRP